MESIGGELALLWAVWGYYWSYWLLLDYTNIYLGRKKKERHSL